MRRLEKMQKAGLRKTENPHQHQCFGGVWQVCSFSASKSEQQIFSDLLDSHVLENQSRRCLSLSAHPTAAGCSVGCSSIISSQPLCMFGRKQRSCWPFVPFCHPLTLLHQQAASSMARLAKLKKWETADPPHDLTLILCLHNKDDTEEEDSSDRSPINSNDKDSIKSETPPQRAIVVRLASCCFHKTSCAKRKAEHAGHPALESHPST